MTLSLRTKLFLVSSLLVVAGLLAAETIVMPRLEREATERMRDDLARVAAAASEALRRAGGIDQAEDVATALTRATGVRVTFIARDGRVLGDGEVTAGELAEVENHASRPEVIAALAGSIGSATRRSTTVGFPFLYVALPPAAGQPITRVALPLSEAEGVIDRIRRSLLIAALFGLFVAALLSTLAAGLVARPLREMTEVARALSERRFGKRLRAPAGDELGDLACALDALSSDLEHTLAEVTRERDLLGAVLDGMADGVLVTDSEGRILLTNRALAPQLGLERDVRGRTLLEVTRNAEISQHVAAVRAASVPAGIELELAGPPARSLRLWSAPLRDSRGVVTVLHEATEVRRLERVRQDFVANVSHELRTPVAALQGAGETLLAGALADPPRAREFVEMIARNAERLGRLVSDLLDLAKLDRGELDLDVQAIYIQPVVERSIELLAARFAEKGIAVEDTVPEKLLVAADARALAQVLANLLDNAAKYTPDGRTVGVEAAAEADGSVRVTVWDAGYGIEPRHRARVFERFYRVDAGRSRALGGTGLGLSIVKHLVESMGGRVGLDERPGGGSRFWFTLPAAGTE